MRKEPPPPNYPPLTKEQLKRLHDKHRINEDVVHLLWEVSRLRGIIRDAERSRQVVDKTWREAGLGELVALHRLKVALGEGLI